MCAALARWTLLICVVAIAAYLSLGRLIFVELYGKEFSEAFATGIVICIASAISTLGTISYRYIVKESGYSYLSKKMGALALFSIASSYILIDSFGLIGAAASVLITELASLTVLNYFFKKGIILRLHARIIGVSL